uniref:Cullin family profile domain-containing protein n=1 Tax=Compsopogon caeruleus TaxID=31354 RepID=A0A7S1TDK0_9RHOD|mmetsp:Transcript_18286/g.38194  ORF Transcript_18286/g.38194 Transcript_18286/m.38194 type:complete len:883 (+) Transcript_18286:200-2848(+)|eukprot:CAMPEP_0184679386 /NCGR_PEP_ID=MMETSP0312-20130426/2220_1 /TAXON_ID=31354 /ORGANISM="Compsopogon coeruleus, Strain SAG 36.94" /LENGTH=882 /DNA_ID=CAMNT_0027128801 /DNA_START=188 /DNA_END=2836 /DNA_ORIENTATION=-
MTDADVPVVTCSVVEDAWPALESVFSELLKPGSQVFLGASFVELHRKVYRVCASGSFVGVDPNDISPPEELYLKLCSLFVTHTRALAELLSKTRPCQVERSHVAWVQQRSEVLPNPTQRPVQQRKTELVFLGGLDSSDISSSKLVQIFASFWSAYLQALEGAARVFSYLDRTWVDQASLSPEDGKSIRRIPDMAIIAWSEEIFHSRGGLIGQTIALGLLKAIDVDRKLRQCVGFPDEDLQEDELVDAQTIRNVLHCIMMISDAYNGRSLSNYSSTFPGHSSAKVVAFREGTPPDFFRAVFFNRYLEATSKFFQRESIVLLDRFTIREYVKIVVEDVIPAEMNAASRYLGENFLPSLREVLEQRLVNDHVLHLTSETSSMLENNDIEDLHRLFLVLSPVEGALKHVHEKFRTYVEDMGADAVRLADATSIDAERVMTFVGKGWNTLHRFRETVELAFDNDPGFLFALDNGCTRFLNLTPHSAKILAQFCHCCLDCFEMKDNNLLQEWIAEKDDDAASNIGTTVGLCLDRASKLFRYVEAKDIFQAYYVTGLSERLVLGTTVGLSFEIELLNHLRSMCGTEYTSRIQRMLNDIASSEEENRSFSAALACPTSSNVPIHHQNWTISGIDFSSMILSANAWPFGAEGPDYGCFKFPESLSDDIPLAMKEFSDYYVLKHEARMLEWFFPYFQITIDEHLAKERPVTLVANLYQAAVLLLFNIKNCWPLSEMVQHSKLTQDELGPHLDFLTEMGFLCRTQTSLEDLYEISDRDRSRASEILFHGKLLLAAAYWRKVRLESERNGWQVEDVTRRSVADDRRAQLQAALVRILKSQREMSHTGLVEAVIRSVTRWFRPSPKDIELALDTLIEREYIARSPNNRHYYFYIA